MEMGHTLIAILVMTAITFFLRALPFIAGAFLKRYVWVGALGNFLPPAMMALLMVHAVADLAGQSNTPYWPECLSVAVTLLVHFLWQKPLPSILSGTLLYVLLLRFFF